jgi:hypothetical protein
MMILSALSSFSEDIRDVSATWPGIAPSLRRKTSKCETKQAVVAPLSLSVDIRFPRWNGRDPVRIPTKTGSCWRDQAGCLCIDAILRSERPSSQNVVLRSSREKKIMRYSILLAALLTSSGIAIAEQQFDSLKSSAPMTTPNVDPNLSDSNAFNTVGQGAGTRRPDVANGETSEEVIDSTNDPDGYKAAAKTFSAPFE